MIKTILRRPMSTAKPFSSRLGFGSRPPDLRTTENRISQLQKEQKKMIVGSMIAADPISSALKRRSEVLATRIREMKNHAD